MDDGYLTKQNWNLMELTFCYRTRRPIASPKKNISPKTKFLKFYSPLHNFLNHKKITK